MDALITLAIYVTPFVALGLVLAWWMRRRGTDLDDAQSQAGTNRRKRRVFLLGFWRDEE